MELYRTLAAEFNIREEHSKNIIELLEEDNTIPFIARYRKEMTGSIDDQVLRDFADRLTYLKNLKKRKEEVRKSIEEQGKWTDELAAKLEKAATMTEVEDIYRPYRPKRKTRASIAIEKGLEPLAQIILAQNLRSGSVEDIAKDYINEEKGVKTAQAAIDGARDIIAEIISDSAELRKELREFLNKFGQVCSKLTDDTEKGLTYEMYKEYSEGVSKIPSHRILALNRGEKEDCLKVWIAAEEETAHSIIARLFVKKGSITTYIVEEAVVDSYKRLIFPSIEREVRNELTDKANEQAIKMFEVNLEPLLMQPPLKGKVIMGFDPAYRTGCKIAIIDAAGNCLETTVVYPTPPQARIEEAQDKLSRLVAKYKVDVIAIGNGTASKESEIFVADLIKRLSRPVAYIIVNEAGASVYSASKLGAEEFPDFDVSLRSAVSIARRLHDPLAELIKIDVKAIGVGQYQHDMPEKRLTEVLDGVVEDCVNKVGVDVNTSSPSLLKYVAGLNGTTAKNIVEMRKDKPFKSKKDLLKVPKLGEKAFEQCAGFLRIEGGKSVFDNTGIHPEVYGAVDKLMEILKYSDAEIKKGDFSDIESRITDFKKTAADIGVGVPTLRDIASELAKPGRDIRDSLPAPILRSDLLSLEDLKPGMELTGTVRNVIDFGAFVDIGVHQDGLVHISQISNRYIKHPSEVLKVGDIVKVRVLEVEPVKKRISLTMKDDTETYEDKKRAQREVERRETRNPKPAPAKEEEPKDLDTMLALLQSKYKK